MLCFLDLITVIKVIMHEKYNLKSDQVPCEAPLSVLASATAEALAGGFAAARA